MDLRAVQARRQGGCKGVHVHPPLKLMVFINLNTPLMRHVLRC